MWCSSRSRIRVDITELFKTSWAESCFKDSKWNLCVFSSWFWWFWWPRAAPSAHIARPNGARVWRLPNRAVSPSSARSMFGQASAWQTTWSTWLCTTSRFARAAEVNQRALWVDWFNSDLNSPLISRIHHYSALESVHFNREHHEHHCCALRKCKCKL